MSPSKNKSCILRVLLSGKPVSLTIFKRASNKLSGKDLNARRHFDLNQLLAVVTRTGELLQSFTLPADAGFVDQLA